MPHKGILVSDRPHKTVVTKFLSSGKIFSIITSCLFMYPTDIYIYVELITSKHIIPTNSFFNLDNKMSYQHISQNLPSLLSD